MVAPMEAVRFYHRPTEGDAVGAATLYIPEVLAGER